MNRKKIVNQFGLFQHGRDEVTELARVTSIKILDDLDQLLSKMQQDQRKVFLNFMYYNFGALMKYLLYRAGESEGRRPSNHEAKWVQDSLGILGRTLDHPRLQNKSLVAHPYNWNKEDIEKLLATINRYGLNCYIHGESEYFPGHTFKVTLNKR